MLTTRQNVLRRFSYPLMPMSFLDAGPRSASRRAEFRNEAHGGQVPAQRSIPIGSVP